MGDNEEIQRLLNQLINVVDDVKVEMSNIRKSLDKIDDSIQEGFYLDWPEEISEKDDNR